LTGSIAHLNAAIDGNGLRQQRARMKRNTDVAYWPVHLHPIFAAIGAGMNGRRLHPEVLELSDVIATVPGHRVSVEHRKGKTGPSGNQYVIEVSGARIVGRWPFRSGELEMLAREAHVHGIGG
jgi:hypothetical protein